MPVTSKPMGSGFNPDTGSEFLESQTENIPTTSRKVPNTYEEADAFKQQNLSTTTTHKIKIKLKYATKYHTQLHLYFLWSMHLLVVRRDFICAGLEHALNTPLTEM